MTSPTALPSSEAPLLVRTSFGDDAAWASLVARVGAPSQDGFLANVEVVDDQGYRDLPAERLRSLLPHGEYVTFFFVADDAALTDPECPLLLVPVPQAQSPFLDEPPREQFRVAVESLWAVENNLSLANLDWADFADHTEHGVYRMP